MAARGKPAERNLTAFLSDSRVLQAAGQIIFVLVLVFLISQIMAQVVGALASRNLTPNLTFLQDRAGFDIAERPDWYSSGSSYGQAFAVGIINTLRIVTIGLVLTTILGVFMGIFLLSSNWLVRTIARTYVEVLRNIPLLVQLFVWYFVVIFTLPQVQQSITVPSEGIAFIPLRWLLYVVLIFFVWRSARSRRTALLVGTMAAFFAVEAAFWLYARQPEWRALYGRSDLGNSTFLLYVTISAVLVVAARFAGQEWRGTALGAAVGQFIGGLLFYFGIAPTAAARLEVYPAVYISIRGFVFPEILPTARLADWLAFVALGVVVALAIWVYLGRITETTGRPFARGRYAALAFLTLTIVGWIVVGVEPAPATVPVTQEDGATVYLPLDEARQSGNFTLRDELVYSQSPLVVALPERKGLRFITGNQVSPEYMALLLALVVYTSSFIADIVRAGIQAVPHGQVEAARSLGMSTGQTLRMIILPQALRVIIPPLGNQYLNLSKNSSLAIAVAYADMFQVTTTIMNQSGQSVTGIFMVMVSYLIISLTIASVTNWFNRQFQIVTR